MPPMFRPPRPCRPAAGRPRPGSHPARWFRWLALLLLALPALRPGANAGAPGGERTIVFFGDSLTAGYGLEDPARDAYPAVIQRKLAAAGLPWRVINAGLSGETTSGGLRRVDWTLRTPVDLFVLALGANDGLRGIDSQLSRRNLEGILARVRARYPQARLVLAGMQMPPELGPDYTRDFNRLFPEVAEKCGAVLVPFLLEGVGGREELNQGDRIHPNSAGHAAIAETVWQTLRPLLPKP